MSIEIEVLQKSVTKCLEEWLSFQFPSEKSLVKLFAKSRWKQNANMISEDKTFQLKSGGHEFSRFSQIFFGQGFPQSSELLN